MGIFLVIFLFLIPIFFLLTRGTRSSKRLPPGSLGVPILGQSLLFLQTMKSNTAEKWLEERVKKYGPISKMRLFGKPTVFIHEQAANKFVFTSDSSIMSNEQTQSTVKILGERNILLLSGEDHKRVQGALVSFLKPESLKQYVGKMDVEVKKHIHMHWNDKQEVKVLPLVKTLTFDIICSLLFGVEEGARRDKILVGFKDMAGGAWSIPINLPFTSYNCSLKVSTRVQNIIKELIREKKVEVEQKDGPPHQDLITCLLSIKKGNEQVLTETEIVQNVMLVMVAGHDTSSVLMTFLLRVLAIEPAVRATVLQEHEEIAKSKPLGELLTWEDLTKMKYTWRVALETLRLLPPVFGGFRKTKKDIEYGGYLIPKGWQIFWAAPMTHMDSSIFSEPSKFDPSRFENQASILPYSFLAFGGGPRVCPRYEFVRIKILVAIHYLVTQFTWKLSADKSFRREPMLVPSQGLPVQIVPRKPC